MSSSSIPPRLPRGLADRPAAEIKAAERMLAKIRHVYELYGFEAVETPLIEYTDALGKFLPDQDRPNEGVFSFQDDDDQWLSLRYDLTAPLARHAAENWEKLPKPYRSYRAGWVFRNEKPGPGRFRQFMQFDADIVGAASVAADAEAVMMFADTLEALGLKRGDYVVRVNNRKVLDGVMEAIGLSGQENAGRRLTVLRAIDKLDKFGPEGVKLLLGVGRKDESGDFTPGAGLDEAQIKFIEPLLSYTADGQQLSIAVEGDDPKSPIFKVVERTSFEYEPPTFRENAINSVGQENALALGYLGAVFFPTGGDHSANASAYYGYKELCEIAQLVHAAGYSDRIRIDPSVVRGLEYYTGPVYEAELTFPVKNEDGQVVRFGSVGGGGRYDGLVSRFLKDPVPATGFSIGVSRMIKALEQKGLLDLAPEPGPVVVLKFKGDPFKDAFDLVRKLRDAHIRAEVYLGDAGMKPQMKYADRRNAPAVVIQGSNEREQGVVQIKDLALGKAMSATITDNKEWRESRPAQQTVPVDGMVDAIRTILKG